MSKAMMELTSVSSDAREAAESDGNATLSAQLADTEAAAAAEKARLSEQLAANQAKLMELSTDWEERLAQSQSDLVEMERAVADMELELQRAVSDAAEAAALHKEEQSQLRQELAAANERASTMSTLAGRVGDSDCLYAVFALLLVSVVVCSLAVPCITVPCRAVPCRALPCLAVPCRALPCRASSPSLYAPYALNTHSPPPRHRESERPRALECLSRGQLAIDVSSNVGVDGTRSMLAMGAIMGASASVALSAILIFVELCGARVNSSVLCGLGGGMVVTPLSIYALIVFIGWSASIVFFTFEGRFLPLISPVRTPFTYPQAFHHRTPAPPLVTTYSTLALHTLTSSILPPPPALKTSTLPPPHASLTGHPSASRSDRPTSHVGLDSSPPPTSSPWAPPPAAPPQRSPRATTPPAHPLLHARRHPRAPSPSSASPSAR